MRKNIRTQKEKNDEREEKLKEAKRELEALRAQLVLDEKVLAQKVLDFRRKLNVPDSLSDEKLFSNIEKINTYLRKRVGNVLNKEIEEVSLDEAMEFLERHPDIARKWVQHR